MAHGQEEGQAVDRPRHGGNLDWAAAIAHCLPEEILDFSASINPLGPPDSAFAAIHASLRHLRDYPDPSYRALTAAIAAEHDLAPDWVVPGNGAAELLTWASYDLTCCDRILLPTPSFGDYRRALDTFGLGSTALPLSLGAMADGQTAWEKAAIDRLISADGPLDRSLDGSPNGMRWGLILNNPHNPTGYHWAIADLLPLLKRFHRVVVDEAFMEFLPTEDQQSLIPYLADYPNLIILRSLTKFYSVPGLRLGYALTHPDRVARWQRWRDPWTVNSLAAAVGVAVLGDRPFRERTFAWLPPARQALYSGLMALGLRPFPSAANYLLVQTPVSAVALQHRLLQRDRLLIRDCLSFPELGEGFFRVAVRLAEENQRLLMALERSLDEIHLARSPLGEAKLVE